MIKIKEDHKNRKVFITIRDAEDIFDRGVRRGLYEIGRENVKHTRKLILSPPKTGHLYKIHGILHQASAPGQPPADFTGGLRRSVNYTVRGSSQMEFGDEKIYGRILELGGMTQIPSHVQLVGAAPNVAGKAARIEPRPHLSRTVREKSRDNFNILKTEMKRDRKFNAAN